ncbi:hypothetical protein ACFL6E_06490 [Candidatus Neomarinimicrobiota bacterium]
MRNSPIFKSSVESVARVVGVLLASLIIAGCNQEVVAPDLEESVIDNADTKFDPETFTMNYAVTVIPRSGGTIDSVVADLYLRPAADDTSTTDSLVESVSLRDDGTGGDIIPSDDVFGLANPAPFAQGTIAEALVIYRAYVSGIEYTLRDSLLIDLPILSDIVLQYDKFNNKIFCSARFSSPTASPRPDTIWAEFRSATGAVADLAATDSLLDTRELFDNQTEGDSIAGDGIYTRLFPSPFDEPITGTIKVLFVVYVDDEIYTAIDTLKMLNRRPVIEAVTMDTIVTRPTSGYEIDWIYVDVSDPDGIADLQSVTFQILKPDSTWGSTSTGITVFHLFDDGVNNEFQGFNDVTAGDGRYSGGLTFSGSNDLGTYQIRFVATDYSNETSDTAAVDVDLLVMVE